MNEKQLYNEALKQEKAGKLDAAVKLYLKSIQQNPAFRPALMNLGAIHGKLRRPAQSIQYYEAALKIQADEAVHFNLGSEYYQSKKYDVAAAHLIACLKINARFLRAHVLLAYVYEARDLPDKAEIYFRNALKIQPGSRIAVLGLLLNLSQRQMYRDGLKVCEAYLQTNPGDETVLGLRAGLLMEVGDYQASTEELQRLSKESSGYRSFGDHIQKARQSSEEECRVFFDGVRERIQDRSRSLRSRIEERKRARQVGKEPDTTELKDDARDMMDLSLMYLFSGESEKAMQFLVQAKKLKDRSAKNSDSES